MNTRRGIRIKWAIAYAVMLALMIHGVAKAQDDYECDYIGQMSQAEWSKQGNDDLQTGVKTSDPGLIRAAIWIGGDPSNLAGTRWYKIGEHERLNVLLMAAVATNNLDHVRDLLARGADPNAEARQDDILTPLITASRCASPAMILTLIHFGADVNGGSSYGVAPDDVIDNSTALIWATGRGDPKIVELLLKEGADPNNQETITSLEDKGQTAKPFTTPLLTNPPAPVLRELLSAGARPNVADFNGETPLMLAAITGSYQECFLLLKSGANPKLKDIDGVTASDDATMSKHRELARWIDAWHPGASLPIGQAD